MWRCGWRSFFRDRIFAARKSDRQGALPPDPRDIYRKRKTEAGLSGLSRQRAGFAEGEQALAVFIPKVHADGSEAFADCHAVYLSELGVFAQHFWQAIERDARVEMMNMVDRDIGAEPVEP